jgi:hypothetical protein
MQTERDASANYSGGGSGESELHERRKVQAARALLDDYDGHYKVETYVGSKRCDALVVLEEPHEPFGDGFVVEYQHKNEQKDIEATERHYARNNYTTVWLREEQFSFDGVVPEIDLFGWRVFWPWPQTVPTCDEWSGTAERYRLRAAIGTGTTTRVEASLKLGFVLPSEQEYWKDEPWVSRFGFSAYNQFRMNESNRMADEYLAAVAGTEQNELSAKLPAEYYDESMYNEYWESTPDRTLSERLTDELRAQCSSPEVDISITQWLHENFWRVAYLRGLAQRTGLLERGHDKNPLDPPKPANPFDDIQCRSCGHYRNVSTASECCSNCGTLYDLSWNVETGRVSADTVREHILTERTSGATELEEPADE